MKKKPISFSGFIAILNNSYVDKNMFLDSIPSKTYLKKEGDKRFFFEVDYQDNFMTITLNHGRPFPYKEKVYNIDKEIEEKNPRSNAQIEPKTDYCMIDFEKSYLWLSNFKNKKIFLEFIMTTLKDYTFCLKDVYKEAEFLNAIKSLNELKFSAEPELFSDEDLSKSMIENIYGYGAEKLSLSFKYNSEEKISDRIIEKIKGIFKKRESFKNVVISGKDENNLGILFNSSNFSRKIDFNSDVDEGEVFISQEVFKKLIRIIKNEK